MSLTWDAIEVTAERSEQTACACCGNTTNEVHGTLENDGEWLGHYMCRWSMQHPEKGVIFQIGLGDWRDQAPADARWMFGATYSTETAGFRLDDLRRNDGGTDATLLDRSDIIDTPFAQEAFAMLDAVFMKDPRLAEVRG